MAAVRGVENLQKELERVKEGLKDVDDNIKKLTGREPTGQRRTDRDVGSQRRMSAPDESGVGRGRGRGRLFNMARRGLMQESPGQHREKGETRVFGRSVSGEDSNASRREIGRNFGRRVVVDDTSPVPAKRRAVGGAFSRLGSRVGSSMDSRLGTRPRRGPDSGDEEDMDDKPALQSSVVMTSKDTKTREEALQQQNKDEKGKARNRRMFGALLGTLQRFKVEETQNVDKEKQRAEVEKKLEEKAKEEKEELRRERQSLFMDRKKRQEQLKKLEHKMELVQIHEDWVKQTTTLMNFIRTKAKPYLFYLPRSHTEQTKRKLNQSKKVLEGIIGDRKAALEDEILKLTPTEKQPQVEEEEMRSDEELPHLEDEADEDGMQNNGETNLDKVRSVEEMEVTEDGHEVEKENLAHSEKKKEKRDKHHEEKQIEKSAEQRRNRNERKRSHDESSGRHSRKNRRDSSKQSPSKRDRKDSKSSPNKPTTPKDGKTNMHDAKEQRSREKRKRRRESKEVKTSMQSLEDKYKDEDGENWASGDEKNTWGDNSSAEPTATLHKPPAEQPGELSSGKACENVHKEGDEQSTKEIESQKEPSTNKMSTEGVEEKSEEPERQTTVKAIEDTSKVVETPEKVPIIEKPYVDHDESVAEIPIPSLPVQIPVKTPSKSDKKNSESPKNIATGHEHKDTDDSKRAKTVEAKQSRKISEDRKSKHKSEDKREGSSRDSRKTVKSSNKKDTVDSPVKKKKKPSPMKKKTKHVETDSDSDSSSSSSSSGSSSGSGSSSSSSSGSDSSSGSSSDSDSD